MSSLSTYRLMSKRIFHDVLYGFWAVCGTRTATLEAKLLQQLKVTREAVLFQVFLPGLFTQKSAAASVPGGGVSGRGFESDQPLGSLCAPPHIGHNSDLGGG